MLYTDGHSTVVRLLLEAGADANIHDTLLVTPLHLAALGGFVGHNTAIMTKPICCLYVATINVLPFLH